ncbi:MAG: hypothetical protein SGPRY_002532, partial [Prymnesium sp.]
RIWPHAMGPPWLSGLCYLSALSFTRALGMSAPVSSLLNSLDNSFKAALSPDPDSDKLHPNKESREVFGQYVEVTPTPLPSPYLVAASPAMVSELSIHPSNCLTDEFIKLFSGNIETTEIRPWATP